MTNKPKPKKIKCEECKKIFSRKSVQKARDGRMLCGNCRKYRVITNKFYSIPQTKRGQNRQASNFYLSDSEKRIMQGQLMKRGLSPEKAWNRVQSAIQILKKMKQKNKTLQQQERIKENYTKIKKQKFLEELK